MSRSNPIESSSQTNTPLQRLCERALFGIHPGIEPIQNALEELGHPERRFHCIHITGSNGKGSVSAMMESIARNAGFRTGLYTSPQLCQFSDRIRINGENIGAQAFDNALEIALDCKGLDQPLTFFEVITIAAFLAFAQAGIEIAILEVGLGGRWDATNIIRNPLATAITSIALEHTKILGSTTEQIAREKAGIFKAGAPYVLGPLDERAESAAHQIAQSIGAGPALCLRLQKGAHFHRIDPKIEGEIYFQALGKERAAFEIIGQYPYRIECGLSLKGPHQIQNAALAFGLSALIARRFPAFLKAIAPGLEQTRWPGRFECFEKEGVRLIFDCAHNSHGAQALCQTLLGEGIEPARTILVFGALADKDWPQMLDLLAPRAKRRIYTCPSAKGRDAAPLLDMRARFGGSMAEEPKEALAQAFSQARPGEFILITGSIYLVAELRAAWLQIPCDPIIPL